MRGVTKFTDSLNATARTPGTMFIVLQARYKHNKHPAEGVVAIFHVLSETTEMTVARVPAAFTKLHSRPVVRSQKVNHPHQYLHYMPPDIRPGQQVQLSPSSSAQRLACNAGTMTAAQEV